MKTKSLSLVAIIAIGFISCQKLDDLKPNSSSEEMILKSTEITVSDLRIEDIAQESGYEAEFFANSEQQLRQIAKLKGRKANLLDWKLGLRYRIGQCPDVSIDTAEAGYPITITLNYGESTELQNGKILSGEIIIVISGPKLTDGRTRTITFSNYSVDSVAIEGNVVQQFIGNSITSRNVSVSSDLTFTLPDGTVIVRVVNRVNEWIEGIETPLDFTDDKIQITGSISVAKTGGNTYVKEIIEPLIKLGDCPYFVQGKTQISLDGEVISMVDFGDGECDNQAVLTTGGETINIDLSGKMPKATRTEKKQGGKGKG